MKQMDIFDVFRELNNTKSDGKMLSEDVNCEFYKQGKCHAIESKEETCTRCWLCQE